MKNQFLLSLAILFSINSFSQEKDFSSAKVGKKVEGVYIFIACEPSNEYDYIGTIDVSDFWQEHTPDEAYQKLIKKAKKKYPNFNGIIFKNDDFHKADLIKFRQLEISGGGFRVGDKGLLKKGSEIRYGEIVQLNNPQKEAGFKYLDEYGDENIMNVPYTKLSSISDDQYQQFISEQNIETQKHKFKISEKVTWIDGKEAFFGEISALNDKNHKAFIKYQNEYGEEKVADMNYLKVEKLQDDQYEQLSKKKSIEINKHKFEVGEKVSYIEDKQTVFGEIISLDNQKHKASIKYFDVFADEKNKQINYLAIEKAEEDNYNKSIENIKKESLKYKFTISEKITWSKNSRVIFNGEITALDELNHKATIKYTDEGKEKSSVVSYLELSKAK